MPFLESLGIPKPRSKAEWSYIFKEMGTFLAAKNFIVNCPLPVMEIPVAPVHDSKEALRFRAVCDERITLPLSSLGAFDSVYTKLVSGLSKSSMVEVKVNWRCNVVHDWVEQVPQEAVGALYDRLGYSQDLIRQLGCSPPLGASGPGERPRRRTPRPRFWGGQTPRSAHRTRAPGDTRPSPRPRSRRSRAGSTSTSKETKHVFWASVECGLVLPSISAWEVVGKEKFKTTGGYMCRFCKGFWRASRGDMDEPPEQLYNQWIRDRMEFYKRVEPTEPPRDERLVLGSSSSGLGMSPLPCGRSF